MQAQESFNRFYVGAHFAPEAAFRFVVNNNEYSSNLWIIDHRNENEKPRFGMTTGLKFGYQPLKWFAIETGAGYSNRGYAFGPNEVLAIDLMDPAFGYDYNGSTNGTATVKFNFAFHYLEIPLSAVFKLKFGKFVLSPKVGAALNLLMRATTTSVINPSEGPIERNTRVNAQGFNAINVTPIAGISVGLAITERVILMASPQFRFGALLITDDPVSAYLWNAGLSLGISYGFASKE